MTWKQKDTNLKLTFLKQGAFQTKANRQNFLKNKNSNKMANRRKRLSGTITSTVSAGCVHEGVTAETSIIWLESVLAEASEGLQHFDLQKNKVLQYLSMSNPTMLLLALPLVSPALVTPPAHKALLGIPLGPSPLAKWLHFLPDKFPIHEVTNEFMGWNEAILV